MPITLPPPTKKNHGSGVSNSQWVKEANTPGSGVSWDQALAGITQNYQHSEAANPAQAAATYISTYRTTTKPKTAPYTGPTASDILKQAKTLNTPSGWTAARASLLQIPNYSAAKADLQITNAQTSLVPKPQKPLSVTTSTVTKTLGPGSTPAEQTAAVNKLVASGLYTPDDAKYVVGQAVTPTPNVPPLTFILQSLQLGTMDKATAGTYFAELGVPPKLQTQYLATAKATYDKWAVMGSDGKIKFVTMTSETNPPKNVLTYGPTPLTQTSFLSTWTQTYKDTFFAYTGRQATGKEVAEILKAAPSVYTLSTGLSQSKPVSAILGLATPKASAPHITGATPTATQAVNFAKSPIYKEQAGGLIEHAKTILGQGWKPNLNLIGQAIAENWTQDTFDAKLRALPAYLTGPAFKTATTGMAAAYSAIYGTPNQAALNTIGQATLAGWSTDEFSAYLRAQPQYTKSQEYVSKLLSFGSALGLITGQQPTLQPGGTTPLNPNKPTAGKQTVPDSNRLPAPSPIQSPIDYSVSGV